MSPKIISPSFRLKPYFHQYLRMKTTFLISLCLLAFTVVIAQAPQGMNYQAVVRNAQGIPVAANTPVALQFNIHNSSALGSVVYTETINSTVNQFGLVNVEIGGGRNLAIVDWDNGPKFLQVLVSINGGTFTDMGTTQLISVPYALYAANSVPGPAGPTGAIGPQGPTGATGPQ